jgi:opacity protein-like surface antigen
MLAVVALVATPAAAQDKKFGFNIGGGYTSINGDGKDHVGNGGNFVFGAFYRVNKVFSLSGEYSYTGVSKKSIQVPVSVLPAGSTVPTDFFGDGHMNTFTFNAMMHVPTEGKVAPYAIVGMGYYDRVAQITTPAAGYATVCDPWWYVCYPTLVPVDKIVGERSSGDFGMNFGGGVDFKLGDTSSFYVEVRYHYVWGPTIDTSSLPAGYSGPTKANGQFWPITFGFRF